MRSVEAIRQELQEVQSQILDLATNSAGCELLESTYYQELAAQRDALQRELLELETGRVFGCYYTRACECYHPEIISPPGNRPGTCRCGGWVSLHQIGIWSEEDEDEPESPVWGWIAWLGFALLFGYFLWRVFVAG